MNKPSVRFGNGPQRLPDNLPTRPLRRLFHVSCSVVWRPTQRAEAWPRHLPLVYFTPASTICCPWRAWPVRCVRLY